GASDEVGWSIGVTSAKSRYEPRNFIVQLVGDDFQDNRVYEVVSSGLHIPLNKPVYLGVSISAKPSQEDPAKGFVTFYMKDLSDPASPLRSETVSHPVVKGLAFQDAAPPLIGGRRQKGHLWDGQLARLTVSEGVLDRLQLLPYP